MTLLANAKLQFLDLLLIDRSGSMCTGWSSVIRAVNSYPRDLERNFVRSRLIAACFDSHAGQIDYTILRDDECTRWRPIISTEVAPRGGTPLSDAIWMAIDHADRLATTETSVCITIISDGQESYSEHTVEETRLRIKHYRQRGWQFIFIGINTPEIEATAQAYGCSIASALNTNTALLGRTLKTIAQHRPERSTPLLFSPRDKKDLGLPTPRR